MLAYGRGDSNAVFDEYLRNYWLRCMQIFRAYHCLMALLGLTMAPDRQY